MKKLNIIYSIFLTLFFYSCLGGEDLPSGVQSGKEATVTTDTILEIGYKEATLLGTVVAQNGPEVSSRGFIIDTIAFNKDSEKIECGEGKGSFSKTLTNLLVDKQYFIKAYAINEEGMSYGKTMSFRTKDQKPTVISIGVTNIIDGTALCSGQVISEGNGVVTQMGICWGISENPTLEHDNVTYSNSISLDPFSVILLKIKGGQKCYYRAFATNNNGTGYGEVLSFDPPPIWERLEDFSGQERVFSATFVLNNNFYVTTGAGGSGPLNDNLMYQTSSNKWWPKENFIGESIRGGIGFSFDHNRYGFVGFGAPGSSGTSINNALNIVYRYDQNDNTWKKMEQRSIGVEEVRRTVYATAFDLNNKAYVIGGKTGTISNIILNEVWESVLSSDNDSLIWTKKHGFPININKHISFTYNNTAYVGLGEYDLSTNKERTIWVYDPSKDIGSSGNQPWSEFTTCPDKFEFGEEGTGTRVAVAVTGNGNAYFMGKQTMWELNLESKIWTKKSNTPGKSYGNIMFSLGNIIYIGINADTREFYRYQPLWDN